jgi:putative hydrolase of the HAD superfamily
VPAPYDAVLLDLYDTVAWSEWHAWQLRLAEELGIGFQALGRALDVTRPSRSVGANPDAAGDLAAVIHEAGLSVTPARLAELRAIESSQIERSLYLYDDSLPVLRGLRAHGVRTALVSNCSHNTRPAVDRLNLDDAFDAVILSFEVGQRKPDPEVYRAALSALGDPAPARTVFVDDQAPYCDGAAELGLDTYLIRRANPSNEGPAPNLRGHREIADLTILLSVSA